MGMETYEKFMIAKTTKTDQHGASTAAGCCSKLISFMCVQRERKSGEGDREGEKNDGEFYFFSSASSWRTQGLLRSDRGGV